MNLIHDGSNNITSNGWTTCSKCGSLVAANAPHVCITTVSVGGSGAFRPLTGGAIQPESESRTRELIREIVADELTKLELRRYLREKGLLVESNGLPNEDNRL